MLKYYLIILAVVFCIFIYNSIVYRKRERESLRKRIRDNFGSYPTREYTVEELQRLAYYFENSQDGSFFIDDITWNDLDMDSIYILLNNTYSSVGQEYLYKKLRVPKLNEETLLEDEKLYSYFEQNTDAAYQLQAIFSGLGRTKSISMYEFIDRLKDVDRHSNLIHYMGSILFIIAVVLLFAKPIVGTVLFFAALIFDIATYYKCKAEIENYFICFQYLADMIICSEKIINSGVAGIENYRDRLKGDINKLSRIRKGSFLISSNGNSGSIAEIVMDYVRMIFHVDIIKFNSMLETMVNNTQTINEMFVTLGEIETAMAVASFRTAMEYYVVPEFAKDKQVKTGEIYHPLKDNPVPNSISETGSVLITGSNASGKSTFLKTIAINLILAQTVHTCTAKSFKSSFCKVFTSMALRDNLLGSESYFIVEIKSIKRIVDAIDDSIPVVCFIDEVLRGTNTVERIAASSYILKAISERNAICFAATHDIELTNILENDYSNYHFEEEIMEDDVLFNYKLNKGRATSRNAIKLLGVSGFDKDIVKNAENMAQRFMQDGLWSL